MEKYIHITNGILDADLCIPKHAAKWTRFDTNGMIAQVTLNGRHTFCQSEQTSAHPERLTSYGVGLSSEFCLDELSRDVTKGNFFPKPGVGLLRQKESGAPYDLFYRYLYIPFEKSYTINKSSAHFHEEGRECLGISMNIDREIELIDNRLTVQTTVENSGSKLIDMTEYCHNFLAIDNLPIDRGYRFDLPFDGELSRLDQCFVQTKGEIASCQAPVIIDGSSVIWLGTMENRRFHKVTERKGIRNMSNYSWCISCDRSAASITGICDFVPERVVFWGVEHCICPEIHCRIRIKPRESFTYARTWVFRDESTR